MSTIAETAAHLDLSERRIYELQDKGVIAKAGRGGIELDVARVTYIRHLRENAAGRIPTGDLDPAQERARKDRALAIAAETKNDLAIGKVVLADVAIAAVNVQMRKLRNKLLSLPMRIATRVPDQVRSQVFALTETEVHAAMEELSSGGEGHVTRDEVDSEAEAKGGA